MINLDMSAGKSVNATNNKTKLGKDRILTENKYRPSQLFFNVKE